MTLEETLDRIDREQALFRSKLDDAIKQVLTMSRRETGWSKARVRKLARQAIQEWQG